MARGWESKNVESQQEDASRQAVALAEAKAEDRIRAERRRSLELTRRRTAADLTRASNPAHRKMLEDAIASLDEQIAGLNPS
jgi:hypothetical protein